MLNENYETTENELENIKSNKKDTRNLKIIYLRKSKRLLFRFFRGAIFELQSFIFNIYHF